MNKTRKFWDEKDGGWFSTTGDDPTVLLRLKEDYDGAEPAASSVSALNTLTLSHLTGDEALRRKAERTLARYGPRIGSAGRTIPMMMCALSAWHAGYSQVVIVGDSGARRPLMAEVARHYLPFSIVIPISPAETRQRAVDAASVHGGDDSRSGSRSLCVSRLYMPTTGRNGGGVGGGTGNKWIVELSVQNLRSSSPRSFDAIRHRNCPYAIATRRSRERLEHDGNDAADWTELDVHAVLKSMLLAIDRAKNPGQAERYVTLRGFSWIVEPADGGVVIALEIPTGAAVAGPFDIPQRKLDALITRAVAAASPKPPVVH